VAQARLVIGVGVGLADQRGQRVGDRRREANRLELYPIKRGWGRVLARDSQGPTQQRRDRFRERGGLPGVTPARP
jgi:hypothetical protein